MNNKIIKIKMNIYKLWNRVIPPLLHGDTKIIKTKHNFSMYIYKRDRVISKEINDTGIWEPLETNFLLSNLNKNDCFIDIGANIGYYSFLASTIIGNEGFVYSFEPTSSHFNLIKETIKLNKFYNIKPFNVAICSDDSFRKIYLNYKNFGNLSLMKKNVRFNLLHEYIQCVNGDNFFKIQNIGKIDFLKIDVEGFENIVLKNLQNIIADNSKHIIIMLEIWNKNLFDKGEATGFNKNIYSILSSFVNILYIDKRKNKLTYIDGINFFNTDEYKNEDMINIILSNKELQY